MERRCRCYGNNCSLETNKIIDFEPMLTSWFTMKNFEVSTIQIFLFQKVNPEAKKVMKTSLTTHLLKRPKIISFHLLMLLNYSYLEHSKILTNRHDFLHFQGKILREQQ